MSCGRKWGCRQGLGIRATTGGKATATRARCLWHGPPCHSGAGTTPTPINTDTLRKWGHAENRALASEGQSWAHFAPPELVSRALGAALPEACDRGSPLAPAPTGCTPGYPGGSQPGSSSQHLPAVGGQGLGQVFPPFGCVLVLKILREVAKLGFLPPPPVTPASGESDADRWMDDGWTEPEASREALTRRPSVATGADGLERALLASGRSGVRHEV